MLCIAFTFILINASFGDFVMQPECLYTNLDYKPVQDVTVGNYKHNGVCVSKQKGHHKIQYKR